MWFRIVISLTCYLFSAYHADVPPSSGPGQLWDCEMVGGLQARSPRLSGVWAPGRVSPGIRQEDSKPLSASDADQTYSGTGMVGPQPQHNWAVVVALETGGGAGGIKGASMVPLITRRLASDDAHAYACSRQWLFMCTALGIWERINFFTAGYFNPIKSSQN